MSFDTVDVLMCACVCLCECLFQYPICPEERTATALGCFGCYRSGSPPSVKPQENVKRLPTTRLKYRFTYEGAALSVRGFDVGGAAGTLDGRVGRRCAYDAGENV
jgi:hypothetical protein